MIALALAAAIAATPVKSAKAPAADPKDATIASLVTRLAQEEHVIALLRVQRRSLLEQVAEMQLQEQLSMDEGKKP